MSGVVVMICEKYWKSNETSIFAQSCKYEFTSSI